MRYKNAVNILPEELIRNIQQYVQGEYIYIPIQKIENSHVTEYEKELKKRDARIFTKHLEGTRNKELAKLYCLSESSIRRIIICQRKRFAKMHAHIKDILQNWNMEACDVIQVYDTTWQIGINYILKVYENIHMLERNIKVMSILGDMNIPVGMLVPAKNNAFFAKDDQYFYILSEKLPGNNIVDIDSIPNVGMKMGEIIADLHAAFKECEQQEKFPDNSLLTEMNGWIKTSFQKSNWKYMEEESFCKTVEQLSLLYAELPVQLIHRDVHFGNFLFYNHEFSGYIDFDLSQRNIRIFDLCYFLLGLLSEEESLNISEDTWFIIMKNTFAGYDKTCKLTEKEREAVPLVMKGIELLFAAWFLEQEDVVCVENAVNIFRFVDKNEGKIKKMLSE